MMVLADLGNTRLKWAVMQANGRPGPMRAAIHGQWPVGVFREGIPVLAVSVAKESIRKKFVAWVRRQTGYAPKFVSSAAAYGDLINAYQDPWRLGADRWVALIGARASFPRARALLVVDVGTATTIDLLARDGRHHGGLILPGPSIMVESLLGKTGGIATRAKSRTKSPTTDFFARDTRSAIEQGARQSVAAAVERARRVAGAKVGVLPRVILTGGGAEDIELPFAHVRIDDLVLRGLAHHAQYANTQ
jgi:type III pantothenate kinase